MLPTALRGLWSVRDFAVVLCAKFSSRVSCAADKVRLPREEMHRDAPLIGRDGGAGRKERPPQTNCWDFFWEGLAKVFLGAVDSVSAVL